MSVYEYVGYTQRAVRDEIEKTWGKINYHSGSDPEDNPLFNYLDRLMRQRPRPGV